MWLEYWVFFMRQEFKLELRSDQKPCSRHSLHHVAMLAPASGIIHTEYQ